MTERFDTVLTRLSTVLPRLDPAPAVPVGAERRSEHAISILRQARSDDDNDAAAEEFGMAIYEAPWVADLHRNYGLVLEKAGNARGASVSLERYLLLNPEAPDAGQVRQKIADLAPLAAEQRPWLRYFGIRNTSDGEVERLALRGRKMVITVPKSAPSNTGSGRRPGDNICSGTISGLQFGGRCVFASADPDFVRCFSGKREYDADGGIEGSSLIIRSVTRVNYHVESCVIETEDRGNFREYQ
jgi:hypothetical protein